MQKNTAQIRVHKRRPIVSAKARLKFILNRNSVRPTCRLNRVHAASCFKQTNDTPVRSWFYAQRRLGGGSKNSFWKHSTQFSARTNFVRRRAV